MDANQRNSCRCILVAVSAGRRSDPLCEHAHSPRKKARCRPASVSEINLPYESMQKVTPICTMHIPRTAVQSNAARCNT